MSSKIREQETSKYWDCNASGWAEGIKNGQDYINESFGIPRFLDFIGNVSGKNIMDAGCGEGRSSRHLAEQGARVTGVDLSLQMINRAIEMEKKKPLGIKYSQSSCSDLPFLNNKTFDSVCSIMALMDFPDIAKAFKEFKRVLKPGGHLTFMIRHPCFFTKGYGFLKNKQGVRARLLVSDYFIRREYIERWGFKTEGHGENNTIFAIPRFPHKISDYFNCILDEGFLLRRVLEPRPSVENTLQNPNLLFWRDNAALFLFVHAQKPE